MNQLSEKFVQYEGRHKQKQALKQNQLLMQYHEIDPELDEWQL